MMVMDKKLKAEWVEALESGKYRQYKGDFDGDGRLCHVNKSRHRSYCCLGVLCEVACVEKGDLDKERNVQFRFYSADLGVQPSVSELPSFSLAEFGLTDDQQRTLILLNDGEYLAGADRRTGRKTFKQIAKWIRKNL